ncbi:MAG TPA: DUF5320 domain-containing protein [Spirochaetota bacterium]|nr:DUF5320 domain-containing protein [Spirochaetota bacterium]
MPGGDRTGPAGMGPMTGRAAGYCAGYTAPGYVNPVPGAGYGYGRGRGWGRGRGFGFRGGVGTVPAGGAYPYTPAYNYPAAPAMQPEQEASVLRDQAKALENNLKQINKRLQDLEDNQTGNDN